MSKCESNMDIVWALKRLLELRGFNIIKLSQKIDIEYTLLSKVITSERSNGPKIKATRVAIAHFLGLIHPDVIWGENGLKNLKFLIIEEEINKKFHEIQLLVKEID